MGSHPSHRHRPVPHGRDVAAAHRGSDPAHEQRACPVRSSSSACAASTAIYHDAMDTIFLASSTSASSASHRVPIFLIEPAIHRLAGAARHDESLQHRHAARCHAVAVMGTAIVLQTSPGAQRCRSFVAPALHRALAGRFNRPDHHHRSLNDARHAPPASSWRRARVNGRRRSTVRALQGPGRRAWACR